MLVGARSAVHSTLGLAWKVTMLESSQPIEEEQDGVTWSVPWSSLVKGFSLFAFLCFRFEGAEDLEDLVSLADVTVSNGSNGSNVTQCSDNDFLFCVRYALERMFPKKW